MEQLFAILVMLVLGVLGLAVSVFLLGYFIALFWQLLKAFHLVLGEIIFDIENRFKR